MEDAGIISNYSIDIDFGKLGLGTNAVTLIKLHDQHKDKIDEIATELRTLPIVVEIYTLLGETDLFIRWMAPSPEAIAKEMNKVLQKESMEKVTTLMLGEQLKSEKSPLLEK
jgi:DNA-binding Lrp family transcriptional regulator